MEEVESMIPSVTCNLLYEGRSCHIDPNDAYSIRTGAPTDDAIDYFLVDCVRKCTARHSAIAVFAPDFYADLVARRPKPEVRGFPDIIKRSLDRCDFPKLDTNLHCSVFRQDLVLLPLLLNGHRVLLAICVFCKPKTQIDSGPIATLLMFDSRPSEVTSPAAHEMCEDIRAFLNCFWYFIEHLERNREFRVFDADTCPMIAMNCGDVSNDDDTGIHVVQTARAIVSRMPAFYEQCTAKRQDLKTISDAFSAETAITPDTRLEMLRALLNASAKRRA